MSARNQNARPDDLAPRLPRVRDDTIVAIATAPGRGAIAVIRLSGVGAEQICRRVVAPQPTWPLRPRVATRCRIHQPGEPALSIDHGLVTIFHAPQSYTGENVVELGIHGGGYVPQAVCAALVEAGARMAAPGEFTERAVLHGKLDLLRAEAIADLIDARTRASHRIAMQHLSGALSSRLSPLRETIIELEALLTYEVDFPEEDLGRLPHERVAGVCSIVIGQLDALLATVPAATLGRDGATIVLAGPPNAGKSSLLNALIGEIRVIVSDQPGTTRDAVEVLLEHDPWPLRLVDTAGLRESADPVERLGIEVSERYLARAHTVVACGESPDQLRRTVAAIRAKTAAPIVAVLTKADLPSNREGGPRTECHIVRVSAVQKEGLDALLARVTESVAEAVGTLDPHTPVITRARHRAALTLAKEELSAFLEAWTSGVLPVPVAAAHVRSAAAALDDLIGTVDIDDVFARVFATFCVGK